MPTKKPGGMGLFAKSPIAMGRFMGLFTKIPIPWGF